MSPEEQEFEDVAGRMFGHPDGQYILNELEKRLGKRMFDSDPLVMAFKVGQYDLIDWLRSFVKGPT